MSVTIQDFLIPISPYLPYLSARLGLQKGGGSGLGILLNLAVALFAAYLAWNCNANESQTIRILYTIFAALFGGLYPFITWDIMFS